MTQIRNNALAIDLEAMQAAGRWQSPESRRGAWRIVAVLVVLTGGGAL
jgi:hypothetical protein